MKSLEVFDPALCCSSGVCGPAPDQALAAFAGALESLKARGVAATRYNLAQQPLAFAQNPHVKAVLEKQGEAGLPLVFVDGELYFRGVYPSADQLSAVLGLAQPARPADETPASSNGSRERAETNAPVAFVKVGAPKPSAAKGSCCDPSSGCC